MVNQLAVIGFYLLSVISTRQNILTAFIDATAAADFCWLRVQHYDVELGRYTANFSALNAMR